MQKLANMIGFIRRQPLWRLIVAVAVLAVAGWFVFRDGGGSTAKIPTFAARRGPLEITVLEGGSLQALESQEIKCEVRVGYQGTKILKIVEEGYLVTDDDVKTNKVLVELDGSDLQKQIVQQEIQYQNAVASLTDSQQGYEIQLNQNQSDIKAAEQKARFARMDFDKFLGDSVTTDLIARLGLDKLLALAGTNNLDQTAHADEPPSDKKRPLSPAIGTKPTSIPAVATNASTAQPAVMPVVARIAPKLTTVAGGSDEAVEPVADEPPKPVALDFSKYANIDALGDGEAKQKLRKFDDDLQVAQKELGQSKTTIEGTRRLFDKGFVTRTDLQRDENCV
jgi:hypothetical protein